MKKYVLGLLVLAVVTFMVAGLSGLSSAQAQAKKEAPRGRGRPSKGGNIRILTGQISPKTIGYIPEWAPGGLDCGIALGREIGAVGRKGRLRSQPARILEDRPQGQDDHLPHPEGGYLLGRIALRCREPEGEPRPEPEAQAGYWTVHLIKSVDIVDKSTVRLTVSDLTSAAMLNYAFNIQIVSVRSRREERQGLGEGKRDRHGTIQAGRVQARQLPEVCEKPQLLAQRVSRTWTPYRTNTSPIPSLPP